MGYGIFPIFCSVLINLIQSIILAKTEILDHCQTSESTTCL